MKTLLERLGERAQDDQQTGGYLFLEQGEIEAERLSFVELDTQARTVAAGLQMHTSPGDRVLLIFPTGTEFVIAFYGCLYARVIPLPANPPKLNRPATRLEAIIKDADPRIILATDEYIESNQERIAQIPSMKNRRWLSLGNLSERNADELKENPPDSSDLAFVQYTSGSTGTPKGVMISYKNIDYSQRILDVPKSALERPITGFLSWAPLFHDMGLIASVIQPVYENTLSVLMSPIAFMQRPARWLEAITKYKIPISGAPNFAFDLCANQIPGDQREGLDLRSWRIAYNSSEPIHKDTIERFSQTFAPYGFRKEGFYTCYGLAETTLMITGCFHGKTLPTFYAERDFLAKGKAEAAQKPNGSGVELVSAGKPLLDAEIAIVDPQNGKPSKPGAIGEVWVRGGSVGLGYWKRDKDTRKTFRAQKGNGSDEFYLRTGDLGFLDDEFLYLVGRHKDVIIMRGKNYYAEDIEATVERAHPALETNGGAAFAVEHHDGERLIVVNEIRRAERRNGDPEEVFTAIKMSVARHHGIRPHTILLLYPFSLPKTSSGKVMRFACRDKFLSEELKVLHSWRAPDRQK